MIARGSGGSGGVWVGLVAGVEGIVECWVSWGGRTGFRYGGTARTRECDHPKKCLFSMFRVFWLADDMSGAHGGLVSRRCGILRELREFFVEVFLSDCGCGQRP